jgi:hypothetical protein
MNRQDEIDHTAVGETKLLQLLSELAGVAVGVRYRRGRTYDVIDRELAELTSSETIAPEYVMAVTRAIVPFVATTLEDQAASDPDPVVRADAQFVLDACRPMFNAINRNRWPTS